MKNSASEHILYGVMGVVMGVTLSLTGFADFTQVHHLFTFQDYHLLFTFMGAVALSMIGFFTLFRGRDIAKKTFNSGTIPGSIMFGVGWAITGACPSIALVQVGEGQLAAIVTIIGVGSGVWMYRKIAAPTFQLDTGVCGE